MDKKGVAMFIQIIAALVLTVIFALIGAKVLMAFSPSCQNDMTEIFSDATHTTKGFVQADIAAGDIDGDGWEDLVLSRDGQTKFYKFSINETLCEEGVNCISRNAGQLITLNSGKVAAGDFDGDGVDEVVIAGRDNITIYKGRAQRNNNVWVPNIIYTFPYSSPPIDDIGMADLNLDGFEEVIITSARDGEIMIINYTMPIDRTHRVPTNLAYYFHQDLEVLKNVSNKVIGSRSTNGKILRSDIGLLDHRSYLAYIMKNTDSSSTLLWSPLDFGTDYDFTTGRNNKPDTNGELKIELESFASGDIATLDWLGEGAYQIATIDSKDGDIEIINLPYSNLDQYQLRADVIASNTCPDKGNWALTGIDIDRDGLDELAVYNMNEHTIYIYDQRPTLCSSDSGCSLGQVCVGEVCTARECTEGFEKPDLFIDRNDVSFQGSSGSASIVTYIHNVGCAPAKEFRAILNYTVLGDPVTIPEKVEELPVLSPGETYRLVWRINLNNRHPDPRAQIILDPINETYPDGAILEENEENNIVTIDMRRLSFGPYP